MQILHAAFVTSLAGGSRLPPETGPIVALVGRSNVGKSSLINALTGRRIARAGATPGTTRLVNLYLLRIAAAGRRPRRCTVADLPGYGYARGGPAARRTFETIVRDFFDQAAGAGAPRPAGGGDPAAPRLAGAVLVIDGRHPGLANDLAARAWLVDRPCPHLVVTTRNDRLSRQAQAQARRAHEAALGCAVLPVSNRTGAGLAAVRTAVGTLLTAAAAPAPPPAADRPRRNPAAAP